MKKYFVIDEKRNGDSYGGDKPYDDLNVAKCDADYAAAHLTKSERNGRYIAVVIGEVDDDGCLDYESGYDVAYEPVMD